MVVIITNQKDVHSDAVEIWLQEWNISYFRFHPDELISRYEVKYEIIPYSFEVIDTFSGMRCIPEKVKSVWFRRPIKPHVHKNSSEDSRAYFEDEISAFLASFYMAMQDAYWVNPLSKISWANDKLSQLREAKRLGFRLPETFVTNSSIKAYSFYQNQPMNCIVKPFRATLIGENIRVFTHKLGNNLKLTDFDCVVATPTVLQEFIDKTSDLRVTVIGRDIFACRIFSQTHEKTKIDFRLADVMDIPHEMVIIDEHFKKRILAYSQCFGLPSCEFDFAEVETGEPYFLECNPNGQWLWIEIMCKVDISKSMASLLALHSGYVIE